MMVQDLEKQAESTANKFVLLQEQCRNRSDLYPRHLTSVHTACTVRSVPGHCAVLIAIIVGDAGRLTGFLKLLQQMASP